MKKNKHLTLEQATEFFLETYAELVRTESDTTIRCTWNDYTDGLHKDRLISRDAFNNWPQPDAIFKYCNR